MLLRTRQQLSEIARHYGIGYRHAQPFPYVVFQGLFPQEALANIALAVEDCRDQEQMWSQQQLENGFSRSTRDIDELGSDAQMLFAYLHSDNFCQFLEELTGIPNLNPDPRLEGSGIQLVRQGGFVDIHAEPSYHKKLNQYRRVKLLLSLNDNWLEGYGGELELWDRDKQNCVISIPTLLNSCVIFSTSERSFHGCPDPLRCPSEKVWKSIVAYYYTYEMPQELAASQGVNRQRRRA